MVPIGTDTVSKTKIAAFESKEEQEERSRKIFHDTHPQYPPPQKRWRPKTVEVNQTTTKTENNTTALQLSAGMADSPTLKAAPSTDKSDHPTLELGSFALRQNTSDDTPTPMEEDNLLGEDLVDYGATSEHSGMDV